VGPLAVRALALLVLIASCSKPAAAPPERAGAVPVASVPVPASPIVLTIVGTSDVHGHLASLPILGGFLGVLRTTRGRDGVILIDAGDMFQGTLESNMGEGAAMIRGYNALGYDAAAIGNHEFDFGPAGPLATAKEPTDDPQGALKERASEARFPLLASNVEDSKTGKPIAWKNVVPSVIVQKRGVAIGLVGVTSQDTPHTTIAANFAGLHIRPIAAAVTEQAAALRKQGATVVILLAHAGGKCKDLKDPTDVASCDPDQEIMRLLGGIGPGTVDAVVAGHTHAGIAHVVSGTPVIQSFSVGKAFGRLDLTIDPLTKKVKSAHVFPPTELVLPATYEGASVQADAEVAQSFAADVERGRARKEEKLGVVLDTPFPRDHDHESPEGNLFADLMRSARKDADVTMVNGGGLRADLPAGELTYGALFEAMPFDNRFATLKMKGSVLRAILAKNLERTTGIYSVSGVHVTAECQTGKLAVRIEHDGKKGEVTDEEIITVVTSDFVATGGDASGFPPNATIEVPTVRDGLEQQLRARAGHIKASEVFDPARRRMVFPGEKPVRCAAR
jgi:5'-nucleotidase